jgi:hypothetical protein
MATSTLASVAGGSSGGGGDGSALPVAVGAGVGGLLLLVALVLLSVVLARRRARAKTLRALASAQQPRPANTATTNGMGYYAEARKPGPGAGAVYALYASPAASTSDYEAPQGAAYDNPLFMAGGNLYDPESFYAINTTGGPDNTYTLASPGSAYAMPAAGGAYAAAGPGGAYMMVGRGDESDMAYERAVPYSKGTDYASPSDYQTPMFVGGQSAGPASSRGAGADGAPQYELAVSGQHYYTVPGAVGTYAQPESAQGGAPWVQLQGYERPATAASAYQQPAGLGSFENTEQSEAVHYDRPSDASPYATPNQESLVD